MGFRAAIILFVLFVLSTASAAAPATPSPDDDALATARRQYAEAMQSINRGDWQAYERLRPALDDYPLAIYLDYNQLTRQSLRQVRPGQALDFISRSAGSPLPNRFSYRYLKQAGQDARWQDFLALRSEEPESIDLKCYYFRAKLAQGDTGAAWEGAGRLWDAGESRPDACDPLFSAWIKAGQLTDDIVWSRQLKAFDARQRSLLAYAARQSSPALANWSDKLQAVYLHPDRMRQQRLPPDSPYSADIASHGLALLARYNPGMALQFWDEYQTELTFTPEQTRQVESAIALQGLFARTEDLSPWLHGALQRLQDDRLVEIRLRWALGEQDWTTLAQTLPLLSEEARQQEVWRYWQAALAERDGDGARAEEMFAALATERSYHGFLAADRAGLPYAFNHQKPELDVSVAGALQDLPAVQRVGELEYHRSYSLAHSEWYYLLQESESERNLQLALLAAARGWYRMAIDAVSRAQAWDALDLRFPMPFQGTFERYGKDRRVPSTELMAIARRESAFYTHAESPVGARGLMQLMPATGRQVASALGAPQAAANLFEVDHNVLLGSAYYRELLDRFGGNRIFALTGYNAGPHRVDRWRHGPGEGVAVDIWVDTIPYKETREYVQAVLYYNVVFQYLMGDTRSLLTPAERSALY